MYTLQSKYDKFLDQLNIFYTKKGILIIYSTRTRTSLTSEAVTDRAEGQNNQRIAAH